MRASIIKKKIPCPSSRPDETPYGSHESVKDRDKDPTKKEL